MLITAPMKNSIRKFLSYVHISKYAHCLGEADVGRDASVLRERLLTYYIESRFFLSVL